MDQILPDTPPWRKTTSHFKDRIDANTKLRQFKQELAWNDAAYGLKSGWVS